MVVEGGDGDLVAAVTALATQLVGEALGRAQVRPESTDSAVPWAVAAGRGAASATGAGSPTVTCFRCTGGRSARGRTLIQRPSGLTVSVARVCNW